LTIPRVRKNGQRRREMCQDLAQTYMYVCSAYKIGLSHYEYKKNLLLFSAFPYLFVTWGLFSRIITSENVYFGSDSFRNSSISPRGLNATYVYVTWSIFHRECIMKRFTIALSLESRMRSAKL
jgi:hypothetical protein